MDQINTGCASRKSSSVPRGMETAWPGVRSVVAAPMAAPLPAPRPPSIAPPMRAPARRPAHSLAPAPGAGLLVARGIDGFKNAVDADIGKAQCEYRAAGDTARGSGGINTAIDLCACRGDGPAPDHQRILQRLR